MVMTLSYGLKTVSRLYRLRKFVKEWNGWLWDKKDEFLDVLTLWSLRRYFRKFPPRFPRDTYRDTLSGCRWRDLYQGAIGNWTGIPARIKTRKQNWMKSGFAGSPTNPIFHFRPLSTSAKFFSEKDQRSSRCWSSLIVYEYIRTCERNRPSPKHSCG